MSEDELAALAGDPDWCANYDYNDIPGLLAEVRRLRTIETAAREVARLERMARTSRAAWAALRGALTPQEAP